MQRSCPNCGAEIFPGARFCRRCGAPLREDAGTGEVSPRAETVPLQEAEGRATDALAPDDGRPSPDTSRVSLSEMERLLRSQQQDAAPNARNSQPVHSPNSAVTRPDVAAERDEEVTISVPRRPDAHDTRDSAALDFERTIDFEATHDVEATRPPRVAVPHDDEELTLVTAGGPSESHLNFENEHANPDGARANDSGSHANVSGTHTNIAGTRAGVAGVRPAAPARRRWPAVVGVCVAVLLAAGALTFVAFRLLRRPSLTDLPSQGPTAPSPAPDASQRIDQMMADAESLLAQGNMEGAVARLREANSLDPSNWRAHRRLGELLIASGARREGIEELRAAARNAPDDFTLWRQLAAAQFAEGLYRDAADSYRRLISLVGDAAEPADLLSYADSLRLSGRAEEARAVYQKLTTNAPPDIADAARQRLGELAQSQPTPSPTPHAGEQPGAQPTREGETASLTQPNAQPTPAPTPAPPPQPTPQPGPAHEASASPDEHYRRGQGLWSSNRGAALDEFRAAAAGGNYDAHYYLGLSYVEGRSLHSLKRAEVVAALQHFQLAQRGRQYVAESRRYQQQLEKEFDRLRGQ
jgi:tetratricopeptide (TPR) repeat protein